MNAPAIEPSLSADSRTEPSGVQPASAPEQEMRAAAEPSEPSVAPEMRAASEPAEPSVAPAPIVAAETLAAAEPSEPSEPEATTPDETGSREAEARPTTSVPSPERVAVAPSSPSPEPDGDAPRRASARPGGLIRPADPVEEEARLREALTEHPDDCEARLALAALLVEQSREQDADALLAEVAADDDTRRLAHIAALARAGRTEEARGELDQLPAAARASTSARMSAARLDLDEGRARDAVRELEPVAGDGQAPARALALYADALLAAGRVGAASSAYSASVERDPSLPEALLGRAEMAVRSRRPNDALRILRRLERELAHTARPAAFRARVEFLRGRAELMAGDRSARRTLHRVVGRPGAPTEAYFFLGEAMIGHDYRGARDAYLRYLELEPDGYYARRARRALGLDEP